MKELTLQEAADLLGMSRQLLITEVLNKGKIPYRRAGNDHRVLYADVVRYQEEREITRRESVMLELMAETGILGLYPAQQQTGKPGGGRRS